MGDLTNRSQSILASVRSGSQALPRVVRDQNRLKTWLLGARRAQVVLVLGVVLGLWGMPGVRDSLVATVFPSKVVKSGFLGLSSKRVKNPNAETLRNALTGGYWLLVLGATGALLWMRLPRAARAAEAPESPAPEAAHSAQLESATPESGNAQTLLSTAIPSAADPGKPGGRYRIERELGRGAMGLVYLAEDEVLGRRVALKKLPEELSQHDELKKRFRREAMALAQLNHPHVVQVFDFVEQGAELWMVMELVTGGDLEERMAGEPMPEAEIARLGRQMAAALASAHGQGIVHRDFKPANVLLTEGGDAKVTDFGLAKLQQMSTQPGESKLTQMGTVMGTPDYMSPEQASGGDAGASSDIYALGATLYEMSAGKPVFEGELAQVLLKHCTVEPPPPSVRGAELSSELEDLILHMLQKSPSDRPTSMAEIEERLAALRAGG